MTQAMRITKASVLAVSVVAVLAIANAGATARRSASDPSLARSIEEWFHSSIASEDATIEITKAKQLYGEHGLPTIEQVGDLPAYEFVVLLVSSKLPIAFRSEVLSKVKEAADHHKLPADAATFYEARLRLDELKRQAESHALSNPTLRDEIERMYKADQAVRQEKGFDVSKMSATDKQHSSALQAILDKYGVPTYSMVGPKAAAEFIAMIQHQPPAFRQRVLPKLKENVKMGEADPESYAMVYDRSQRDLKKNQLYGEQLECDAGQQMHEAPIEDEAHVDERRAELGLIRVELYARIAKELMPQFCPPANPEK
ncbi:MAG TPA: DUF6624 domain-containing protein [Candidatus Sulfotelmatobacter sp.]|nr:DUF6624 domain-containing protein [Candidatus Sulfotelmatobacter sp.]